MQSIQLYIDGQRVELFKDESISLTQSIQNVRDVAKVFTDFSKTFSVPASKTNNKIFKHYYNFDIINGYDARTRAAGEIELNHLPFRKGYIKLEGVNLKDNKPHTYKITFFGETVELVDLFGDDELDALDWLDNFNVASWNADNVMGTTATNGYISEGSSVTVDGTVYSDAVVAPLITHTDRLYYDSGTNTAGTNNLYFSSGTAKGVSWLQLKPAIRVHLIIKAIEDKYSITFSDDFFDETNTDYYDLRLWLHRNKGNVFGIEDGLIIDQIDTLPDFNSNWEGVQFFERFFNITDTTSGYAGAQHYATTININTSDSDEYNFVLKEGGNEVFRLDAQTGNNNFDVGNLKIGSYTIFLEGENPITVSGSIDMDRVAYDGTTSESFNFTQDFTMASDFLLTTKAQTPKIKVIDFLTGLFKMFNLTAYKKDGVIVVKTLDEFYSDSTKTWDITEFVDVTDSEVLPALPYREVTFKYKGLNTFLADNHLDLFNKEWSTEEYKGEDDKFFYGSNYVVELPFEHMKFERLFNENTGSSTAVQYGWFVDKDTDKADLEGKSIKGDALLFYAVSITDATGISGLKTSELKKTKYYIPSNSIDITDSENINFKPEKNEYTNSIFYNTLYDRYYKKYISEIFDLQKRLTRIKAYLPLKVLLNYTLADKFSIKGQGYKINSINTNLESGVSELELLNVPVFITEQNEAAPVDPTTTTATNYVQITGATTQQVNNNITLTGEDFNFTGTTWAWTGNGAAGKSTKVITFTESSAGSKTYNVSVDGTYTDSHDILWTAAPSLFITISGATSVNETAEEVYSSSLSGTATNSGTPTYQWTTSGGTIIGSSTNATVTIQWNSGGNKTVTCTATQQNVSASDTLNVSVAALALPQVQTVGYDKGETDATLKGQVTLVGNPNFTQKGFYWKQGSGTPTASDETPIIVSGTTVGQYEEQITGLTASTQYSFRAFATNTQGTALGVVSSFTTDAAAVVYNYYAIRRCNAQIDRVVATTQTATVGDGGSGTYSVWSINGHCYYAYNTATEAQWNSGINDDDFDEESITANPSATFTTCTDCTGQTTSSPTTTTAATGNAYTVRKSSFSASAACTAATTTVYGSPSVFVVGSTTIYSNSGLTLLAGAGYYSDGTYSQQWSGSAWIGSKVNC